MLLTEEQLRIVAQAPRNTVVFAAPGSGKTTVLTEHIANQVRLQRVSASHVLALTFTHQSARDMQRRMRTNRLLSQQQLQALHLGTFHAEAFHMLLKQNADIPVVLSPAEQFRLMQTAAKRVGQGDAVHTRQFLLAHTRIQSVWPRESQPQHKHVERVLAHYQHLKAAYHRWDFDDILHEFLRQLNTSPDIVHWVNYLLVDEYQDTNPLQWTVIKAIASSAHCPVFVVGDDDQSIYGFRGASPQGLLSFPADYPDVTSSLLTTNFRSTTQIVQASVNVIVHNNNRQPKTIHVHDERVGVCRAFTWSSEEEEAFAVWGLVQKAWERDDGLEISILSRTRRQLSFCFRVFAKGPKRPQFRTFHDAKGKEWDVVHILGAVNRNPYLARDREEVSHPSASEEDRRLFYVAMTRARTELFIHMPLKMNHIRQQITPYVEEAGIPVEHRDITQRRFWHRQKQF